MKSIKIAAVLCSAMLAVAALAGCAQQSQSASQPAAEQQQSASSDSKSAATDASKVEVKELPMQYISQDDAAKQLSNSEYVFLDMRKAADYQAGHIPGAISADMDAAKGGDVQSGLTNMAAALGTAGTTPDSGKKLVLVCYSGKSYAQAGTNILGAMGMNMDNVYTLEGGMKAWTGDTKK